MLPIMQRLSVYCLIVATAFVAAAADPAFAAPNDAARSGSESTTQPTADPVDIDTTKAGDAPGDRRPFKLLSWESDVAVLSWDRAMARQAAAGQESWTVSNFPLGIDLEIDLELKPFQIVGPDTRFVLRHKGRADQPLDFDPASVLLFRGQVRGHAGSHVFLALRDGNSIGFVDLGPGAIRYLISSKGRNGQPLGIGRVSVFQPGAATPVALGVPLCGVEGDRAKRLEEIARSRTSSSAEVETTEVSRGTYTVGLKHLELAVETDYEYFALFGDAVEATAYLIQMYGAVSDIYMRDVDTRIEVVYTGIWTDPDDEYNGPDPLSEFYTYWEANMGGVDRDAAQLFSGRRNYPFGGQAFVSQLCNFAYGVVGYAVGFFPDPSRPSPYNYDVSVTAHEIGHNAGAPHTHGIGIDTCDNPNTTPQRGSIMSYCGQTWSGMGSNTDNYFHTLIQDTMDAHIGASSACIVADCNMNNVADSLDIFGNSDDVNGNGIPDECEDCNNNGILDPLDIAGASDDDNSNGIPDECEPDCNNNGFPDDRDIALAVSTDLYGDDIPDECETDCNSNGTSDYTEIQLDMTLDIDRNAALDSCQDCDDDGTLDHDALDGSHNLWVASGLADSIVREFFATTGVLAGVSSGASLVSAGQDVIVAPSGNVLVTSAGDNRVMEFDADGNYQGDFVASGSGGLSYPTGLLMTPGGTLLVCSRDTDSVLAYSGTSGAFEGVFIASGSGGLAEPFGLTFTPAGNLLVTSSTNEVLEYDGTSGSLVGPFVDADNHGTLDQPRGMTFKADGNLLVCSFGTDEVLEFDGETGAPLGKWAQVGTADRITQDSPWGIRVGPNGHVYVSRTGTEYSSNPSSHDDGDLAESHLTDARMFEYDVCTGLFRKTQIGGNDHGLFFATGFDFVPGFALDCNLNQLPDDCDIASGFSEDSNTNGVPDECESDCNINGTPDRGDLIPFGASYDCNCNFIPDECDVTSGASVDCDGNGVPDECEDCNNNGIGDACDVDNQTSDDCNSNGIPDECESQGDCNGNGVADICDLANGSADDCNNNGIPDTCDAGSNVLLDVDFEGGLPAGWSTTGIFQVTTACPVNPVCDGIRWAYAGSTSSCSYGDNQSGELISPPVPLPPTAAELTYCSMMDTEGGWDFVSVYVNGDLISQESGEVGIWQDRVIDLTAYGGETVVITFGMASDGYISGMRGWQVDNIQLTYLGSEDCDGNGVPDECDPDCDGDGIPDACDGSSECDCPISLAPEASTPVIAKNRYLSIVPTNSGRSTALRVNLKTLPAPFSGFNGTKRWVRQRRVVTELSGEDGDTPAPTFAAATLGTAPDCMDWGALGAIDVYGIEIVPGAEYEVQAIDCLCDFGQSQYFSTALTVSTSIWGDLVGSNFDSVLPGRWDPPQGTVDFVDIGAIVDKFRNLAGAPLKARSDLSPDPPDLKIDFVDISRCVDAFRSFPYPFDGPQ